MISKNDVKHIANLSRIHLRDEEIDKLTSDLERILGYIQKLAELDVSKVEPTTHALPLNNVYREDKAITTFTQQEALNNAPEKAQGSFKVPKVIE